MPKEIFEYLNTQRIGVLAVEMRDGSPHAATVHFAHTENPLVFYFETSKETKKAEALMGRQGSRASFVIGVNEEDMKTLQMDGMVEILKAGAEEIGFYFEKFSRKKEMAMDDPDAIFFKFTPMWWRFTDWHTPEGKKIWTS